MSRAAQLVAGIALLALSIVAQAQELLDKTFTFDIEPQAVSTAILELSKQAGIQVAMAGGSLDGAQTQGLHGSLTLRDALTQLLQGTQFAFTQTAANTITIAAAPTAAGAVATAQPSTPEASAPLPTIPVQPQVVEPKEKIAKEGSGVELEQITVTAGKRVQDVRNVPGSVSALQGKDLEKRGAQNLEDYLKLVPGVTFSKDDVDSGMPIIRGIATDIQRGQTPPNVGIYVDEIAMADPFFPQQVIDMNPFDLERVEILKGPQGTLFGSGALNGAIRYITHKPELNLWSGKVMGSYTAEKYGERSPAGAAMINAPIGQSAALRVVGFYRIVPGVVDDETGGTVKKDVDGGKQFAIRALAAWTPLDDLNLNLTFLRQRSYQDNAGFTQNAHEFVRADTPTPTPRDSSFEVGNLVASYDFSWARLLSSTSLQKKSLYNQTTSFEGTVGQGTGGTPPGPGPGGIGGDNGVGTEDQGNLALTPPYLTSDTHGFLEELRLSSLDTGDNPWHWLIGASYQRENERLFNPRPLPLAFPIDFASLGLFPIPTPAGDVNPANDLYEQYIILDAIASEFAGFGEVSFKFWDRLELTAGARLFKTHLDGNFFLAGAEFIPFTQMTESNQHAEVYAKGVNPKFSVNFFVTPNLSVYGLGAKGFQFGGVQILPPTVVLTNIANQEGSAPFAPYKSSQLWNYEVGARTDWFGHRLQLDATLFYEKWSDLQLTQSDANNIFSFVANIGSAHSRGVEVALQALPLRGLRLTSSAAWIDAVTDEFFASPSGDVQEGTQLPGAAKFSVANSLSYDLMFDFLGRLHPGFTLTHTYTGKYFNDLQHTRTVGDYHLLDAQVHLLWADQRFRPDLSFTVTNVLDKRALSNVLIRSREGDEDYFLVKPRTAVLSLAVQF